MPALLTRPCTCPGVGRGAEGRGARLGQVADLDQLGEHALAGDRVETAVLADDGDPALVLVFV
jgi:hypothetical protein